VFWSASMSGYYIPYNKDPCLCGLVAVLKYKALCQKAFRVSGKQWDEGGCIWQQVAQNEDRFTDHCFQKRNLSNMMPHFACLAGYDYWLTNFSDWFSFFFVFFCFFCDFRNVLLIMRKCFFSSRWGVFIVVGMLM